MQRILAAVDLSDSTDDVIEAASTLSKNEHARMCVVYVQPRSIPPVPTLWGETDFLPPIEDRESDMMLEQIREEVMHRGIEVQVMHLYGTPAQELQDVANAYHADLVVMGAHERSGISRLFSGGVRDSFLRHTGHPVLVIPHRLTSEPSNTTH